MGCFLRSGRPRGPGKTLKKVGGFAPHILKAFPGPRGRPDLKNATRKNRPGCLQVPKRELEQTGAAWTFRNRRFPVRICGVDRAQEPYTDKFVFSPWEKVGAAHGVLDFA